jgi:hypothetical protein
VKRFAEQDERIKFIINETNLHIAESRNQGLEIAKGEYIGFSDHDDTRSLDMYEMLYARAKSIDADIVFSSSYVNNNAKVESVKYNNPSKKSILRSLILPIDNKLNENRLSKSVWASIYKKSFIESNSLKFKDRRIYYEEDTLFNLKAFLSTNKISYVDKEFYVWNKSIDSESNKPDVNVAIKQINFLNEMFQYLCEKDELDNYKNEILILISEWISSRNNFPFYNKLSPTQKYSLLTILRKIHFPFYGKSNDLKFFGRRRIKLSVFIVLLYLDFRRFH